jgi:hypothetical protein
VRPNWKRGGDAARSVSCTASQALAVRPGPFRTGPGTHGGGRHGARGPTAKAEDSPLAAVEVNPRKKSEKFRAGLLTISIYKYIFVYTEAELLARKT